MRHLSLLCAVAAVLGVAGRGLAQTDSLGAADLAQAKAAAHKYLELLAADNRPALKKMQPTALECRYGPYPFADTPSLGQPKVDAHRAGIEFRGKAADPALPSRGAFILTKEDKDPKEPWKIRSIFWYEQLPLGVKMPASSVTSADVAQEPRVKKAVQSYLHAWRLKDWAMVKTLTFDWLSAKVDKPTRAGLRSADLRLSPTPDGEVKVDYTATVVFFRVFPRTVSGRLYCVREDGAWKVRGDAFML